jgi:predicted Zn-dependent peptidase
MTGIVEIEHQGVPTVLASRAGGGTMSAGLVFRVGRADETLATAGITHLVEHLALHEHGLGSMHFNGQTDETFTHFHVEGSESEVVSYLNGVCRELNDLPVERLETEKDILRTEARSRGTSAAQSMALYRYGAQGYGLPSYDELGLPNATPDALRAWVARWFTRQNAALWISADRVPDGLQLLLRDGARQPMPAVSSALPEAPAWYPGPGNVTCMHSVIPRSTAAALFAGVLSKRLFRELRQQGGLCYTATAQYAPRDNESAVVWAVADADPQKREAVVGGMVDVLAGLRFGPIEQSDLDAVRESTLRKFDEPDAPAMRLPGHAMNLLSGHRIASDEQLKAEICETTVEDLAYIAAQVWSNALFQTPGLPMEWAGVAEAPRHSRVTVRGREFASLQKDDTAIVVGPEGVSGVYPDGRSTVRYRDTAAMLAWADGGRRLIGRDGFIVHIEPTIHPVDATAVAQIDGGVPQDAVVHLPARDPEEIPRPASARAAKARSRDEREPGRPLVRFLWNVAAWVFAALAALFVLGGVGTIAEVEPETRGEDIGTIITGLVMSIGFEIGRAHV